MPEGLLFPDPGTFKGYKLVMRLSQDNSQRRKVLPSLSGLNRNGGTRHWRARCGRRKRLKKRSEDNARSKARFLPPFDVVVLKR